MASSGYVSAAGFPAQQERGVYDDQHAACVVYQGANHGAQYARDGEPDGEEIQAERDVFEVRRDDYLPMWGTMWAFGDSSDEDWLENGGLQKMADCGFRIYEQEDYGYIFGIDGAGYSFFDEHFEPLYKARGLRWHDEKGKA